MPKGCLYMFVKKWGAIHGYIYPIRPCLSYGANMKGNKNLRQITQLLN